MPKFVVIHTAPKWVLEGMLATPPGQSEIGVELRKRCTFDAYWIRSWAVPEQEKFYCEWNAKDAESIRKAFEGYENLSLPVEAIYEMRVMDAEQDIGR